MKTRLLIIISALIITSALYLIYHVHEEEKAKKLGEEQIKSIFNRCEYQKMMDERDWIGFDGNKITDHQPLMFWQNSTHHLDNNYCQWITMEKYLSDAKHRESLEK